MSATLPATGLVVATEEVGGQHKQIVKVDNLPAVQPVSADQLPLPTGAATEATLAAIKQAADAIKTAAETLAGRTINTASIGGTVALDGPTLAALETINAATGGLTNTELRASAVPVSAAALPLPAGAATEATLSSIASAVKAEDSAHVSGDLGVPMLALRQSADSVSTSDDGDYANLKTDEEGRLKVATKPASFDAVTGALTALNAVVVADVRRASNVVFHVKNTGSVTLAAGTFVFEASIDSTNGTDGTWFAVQAIRSNANTIETSIALSGIAAAAGYASAWEASVNAYAWFRLRCSVAVTASAVASWTIQRGSYATEPIPAAQISGTQPVSGTVTANQGTLVTPTPLNFNSAATTNLTSVKASAGTLYNLTIASTSASARYLKLYNKASAPVVASDVPVMTITVAAGASFSLNFGATGHRFATGIALALTGAVGDTDATATAANEVRILGAYI